MAARPTARRTALAALLGLGLVAVTAPAAAAPRSDTVLVKLDPGATRAERADVHSALDAVAGQSLPGGWRAYRLDEGVTVAEARADLAGTTADVAVELDRRVRVQATPNDPSYASQWDMNIIGAPAAWDLSPGDPVIVAVTDTGTDTAHPELAGRLWTNPGETVNGLDDDANGRVDDVHGWDFLNHDASLFDAAGRDSHGTHVAGTIAATRNNGIGIAGISPTARIMTLKFLEDGTGGYVSDGMLAIDYAVDEGARIINASWGGSGYSQALCDTIQDAVNRGVIFIAAAGNSGLNETTGVSYPAACPSPGIVSVASTDQDDGRSYFTNHGATTVDLGAPGNPILSLAPGGGYSTKAGTSMAAPHVTGVAALLLARHPGLTVPEIKALLMNTGDPASELAGTTVSGRRLSASGALAAAAAASGPDTAPPTQAVVTAPSAGAVQRALTVRWHAAADAGSGIAGYRVVIDGATAGTTAPGVRELVVPSVTDGAHTVRVEATDGAGNTSLGAAVSFRIDTVPPDPFAITTPAATDADLVDITWNPANDASGVANYLVGWDGGVVSLPGDATALPFPLGVGAGLSVSVTAEDPAGNSRTVTHTVVPAPAPPDPPSDSTPAPPATPTPANPAPVRSAPRYRLVRRCTTTVRRVRGQRVVVKRCTTVRVRIPANLRR